MVMRLIRRICVIGFVLLLAISAGFAGTAASKKAKGKKTHVASQVTFLAAGPEGLSGRVKAKGKACHAQRQVLIYRVNSGPSVPSSDFLNSTWTRGDGSWTLPAPQSPGQYYAQVLQKKTVNKKKKKKRTVICRSASSNAAAWS
jgi:hypothetical protein